MSLPSTKAKPIPSSSGSALAPKPANPNPSTSPTPLPFTIGVEIEHILAIRRSALLAYQTQNPYGSTQTYLQRQFAFAGLPSTTSTTPHTHTSDDDDNENSVEDMYSTWLITTDGSLDPEVAFPQLLKALPDVVKEDEAGMWETHAIELVSPPMVAPDVFSGMKAVDQGGLGDLRRYLDVLHGRTVPHKNKDGESDTTTEHPPHAALTTLQCGLHVHIGLPYARPIPLRILQHLALLLLAYEDVISSLHHHSRTPYPGTQASQYATSNKVGFLEGRHGPGCRLQGVKVGFDMADARKRIFAEGMTIERLAWMMGGDGEDAREELVWVDEVVSGDGNAIALANASRAEEGAWESAGSVRSGWNTVDASAVDGGSVLSETEAEGSTLRLDGPLVAGQQENKREGPFAENALIEQLTGTHLDQPDLPDSKEDSPPNIHRFATGNKYKITRWNLLDRHPSEGPRTIEFRQAAGSVDAEEIGETIRLYVALLRCAERRADMTSEEFEDCLRNHDEAEPTLESLLAVLGLPAAVRQYWLSRAERLANERFFDLRDPKTMANWQICGACAQYHEHRCETRRRRAMLEKGWQAFRNGNHRGRKLWRKFTRLGIYIKDEWGPEPAKDEEARKKPEVMLPYMKNGKGKKSGATRKEKSKARTRARVLMRRQEKRNHEAAEAGLSTSSRNQKVWAADDGAQELRANPAWDPSTAGASLVPHSGW